MNNVLPCSYHNFLFPFLWNDDSKVCSRKKFEKCLNPNWILQKDFENRKSTSFSEVKYKQYHYFNPAARNAIYSDGKNNDVVWNYTYNIAAHGKVDGSPKAEYIIKREDTCYKLNIRQIRLKLFDMGIGVLCFELENYDYPSVNDINKINDWGRQIYVPYLSGGKCNICPEEIALRLGEDVITGKLVDTLESFDSTNLIDVIKYFFTNSSHAVTADKHNVKRNTFYIEPVIDNRMFVACYYANKEFAVNASKREEDSYAYSLMQHATLEGNSAAELYKLVYVDGNGLTCQSRNLLSAALDQRHIYDRWIEYGSITGITEYSFVTLTKVINENDYLVENFLTQYLEMIILVLAQRATLLNFERMIVSGAKGKKNVSEIHKRYLRFQSQLLLSEVTPQQQGIELYNMLLDNMFISNLSTQIEDHIEDLFANKTAQNESAENLILFVLATFGVFETINIVIAWISDGRCKLLGFASSFVILIWVVYFWVKRSKKF